MKKSTVRIICVILGLLMVAGTMALVASGIVTSCENAKAKKEAESKETAAIVYDIEEL